MHTRTRRFSATLDLDRVSLLVILIFTLMIIAGAQLSCAGATQTIKTWSGAFAGCEKTDLGQLVQSGDLQVTLLDDVAALIEDDGAQLEADLTSLAGSLGLEAVHCAILAAETVLAPRTAKPASQAIPRGLARAKAWLETQYQAKAKGGTK